MRRDLHYAHQGKISERCLARQTEQAWCLTVLTNSVVAWTTEYYGLAIAQMRAEGRAVDDELLAHISPAHSENSKPRHDQRRGRHRTRQAQPGRLPATAGAPPGAHIVERTALQRAAPGGRPRRVRRGSR
ncbi:Tn3 family transposase [Streptomyces sp. A5-4]|uniref:Tn3 family transposase n=1 Tax=Streptomyces sp. A5-4 TaxID=3384771 RepID=UPI003DA9D99C